MNADKGRQEKINGPEDMGENSGGAELTKTKPETEEEIQFIVERIGVVKVLNRQK